MRVLPQSALVTRTPQIVEAATTQKKGNHFVRRFIRCLALRLGSSRELSKAVVGKSDALSRSVQCDPCFHCKKKPVLRRVLVQTGRDRG